MLQIIAYSHKNESIAEKFHSLHIMNSIDVTCEFFEKKKLLHIVEEAIYYILYITYHIPSLCI